MNHFLRLLVAALLIGCASSAWSQDDHAYTEGQVTQISYIKVKPGMFDAYMRYLQGPYKQLMEEQKKAGLIVGYAIYAATARAPHEADLYLTITYKNYAALDGLTVRSDALVKKVFGSLEKSDAASIDRGKLREELGSELVQELVLK
jgi:hypothetical protein